MNAREIFESSNQNALSENQQSMYNWVKFKEELKTTKELVQSLPEKLSHRVMVPLTSKAMIPGRIVHTNEFLVGLGADYLVKKTSKQANEFIERRIGDCDEMLGKLEKELEFLQSNLQVSDFNDAFGSEDRPEISEFVSEEEDKAWREEHRIKVKEHHRKLAELKKEEKKIVNEQDLWERLDQLELEEELEDELNRLYDEDEDSIKTRKKSVVFIDDDSSEPIQTLEPIVLNFKHSDIVPKLESTELTPGDIYKNYLKESSKPVSILKVKKNPNESKERASAEETQIIRTAYEISDVVERNPWTQPPPNPETKRISKFKASRIK